jgi:hypothetical protein
MAHYDGHTEAAREQYISKLEANLFAATATVADLEAKLAQYREILTSQCELQDRLEHVEQERDRLREALRRIADNLREHYPRGSEMFKRYIRDEDWWTSGRANNDFECWFAERALKEG